MTATKDALASPTKLTAQQKNAMTNDVARQIIASEVSARETKTEKLRKLRLEQEATEKVEEETPKAKKKK